MLSLFYDLKLYVILYDCVSVTIHCHGGKACTLDMTEDSEILSRLQLAAALRSHLIKQNNFYPSINM